MRHVACRMVKYSARSRCRTAMNARRVVAQRRCCCGSWARPFVAGTRTGVLAECRMNMHWQQRTTVPRSRIAAAAARRSRPASTGCPRPRPCACDANASPRDVREPVEYVRGYSTMDNTIIAVCCTNVFVNGTFFAPHKASPALYTRGYKFTWKRKYTVKLQVWRSRVKWPPGNRSESKRTKLHSHGIGVVPALISE